MLKDREILRMGVSGYVSGWVSECVRMHAAVC